MKRGPKPLPKVKAAIETVVPKWPKQLMNKPAAQQEWKRIWPELQRRGLWQDADQQIVLQLCEATQDFAQADAELQARGAIIEDCKGSLKSNPAARQKHAAGERITRILAELGLTPSAIARRDGAGGMGEENPLTKLLRERHA